MKEKVSKSFIWIMSFTLIMTLLLGCTGCIFRDRNVKYEDGFFEYIIVKENSGDSEQSREEVVAIIGFTYSGMEQEVIDFPREIDGKPVRYIGYLSYNTLAMSYYYHLESDNLKKVYIHENIKSVYNEAFSSFSEKDYDLDIMICAPKTPELIFKEHYWGNFYLYKSFFDSSQFGDNIYGANIVFMNNYSDEVNEGYYSLDNIEPGEKIPEPTRPVRSGYEFVGWYTEAECVNAWNFDESPAIEEDTEFRLYAGWRAL